MIAKPLFQIDKMPTKLSEIIKQMNEIILGKEESVKMILAALLARGHVLIEDMPGMGKTTLAKGMARILGLKFSRIQCTNDMLPADILGINIFDAKSNDFHFKKGPLFSEIVLVDELNRATPKTQSALLQAMEERAVDIDGQKYQLPPQFLIIATQNPFEQVGVYQLPESQLDRFLFRFRLGFPDRESERKLLVGNSFGNNSDSLVGKLQSVIEAAEILELQNKLAEVKVSDAILNYIQDLVQATRTANVQGLSPRGSIALVKASQAWAVLAGRSFVLPEDVQSIALNVMSHRLNSTEELGVMGKSAIEICHEIIKKTPIA